MPKRNVVYMPFYGFHLKNIEFPQLEMLWDTNVDKEGRMVCKGRFFNSRKCMSLTAAKKLIKAYPTKLNNLIQVCLVSRNFKEGNGRKFAVVIVFAIRNRKKISKNTDVFLGAHED